MFIKSVLIKEEKTGLWTCKNGHDLGLHIIKRNLVKIIARKIEFHPRRVSKCANKMNKQEENVFFLLYVTLIR